MSTLPALATLDTFRNRIFEGDALTLLRSLPENSVHCIVTSPPYYGLRSYLDADHPDKPIEIGLEDTPDRYVARMVEVFRLARRVLRDDGVMWVNIGDSYANTTSGTGSRGGSFASERAQWQGESSRKNIPPGLKPKDLIGIPWRLAFALQADGWWLRSDIIWHKPNPMPESVTDRPTKAHEYVFLLTKSAQYWYDADAIREAASGTTTGGFSNRVHSARREVISGGNPSNVVGMSWRQRNARTVWTVATEPSPYPHFAMFPQKLIAPMILAGCPETVCAQCGAGYARVVERTAHYEKRQHRDQPNGKPPMVDSTGWKPATVIDRGFAPSCQCNASATGAGIVLDPFMGTGTTALVARANGRDYIGSDLNAEYVKIARERLRAPFEEHHYAPEPPPLEDLPLFAGGSS